ncbi:MAG: M50 family metallopeptidase [Syntrophomonadaceae bacterium]
MLVLIGLSIYLGYGHLMLLLMAALLFHEMAHVIAARSLGVRVQAVELTPFGGQAQIDDFTAIEPDKEILMSLAGPLSSLSLAAFFYFLPTAWDAETTLWLVGCNLFLGLFNLLPALPMDGGRMLRSWLSPLMGFRRATQLAAFMGVACALGIICHGALYAAGGINMAWELLAGLILLWFAVRESRFLAYSFLRCLIHKKSELNRRGFLESRQVVSSWKTPVRALLKDIRPKFYLIVVAVDDAHHIVGIYTEAELIECFMENGPQATLRQC